MSQLLNSRLLLSSALFMSLLALLILFPAKSSAMYDNGKLIDDMVFLNAKSMTETEIQNFLVSKGGGIANKTFVFDCTSTGMSDPYYRNAGAPCGQTVPASTIIYYAAQIYGVNPQVILATMQKEQSLITAPNPTSWQVNQAMGYGCPDSGGCSATSGFLYQVDNGTWVLRFHMERARGNMTYWFTSTSWVCGTAKNYYKPSLYPYQNVNFYDDTGTLYRTEYLKNAATSSFYCYTPHTYNNPQGLYGLPVFGTVGQYYSGSYNFVRFFELWFGQVSGPSAFRITGDTSGAIYVPFGPYRYVVPHAAVMQDYGISWEAVQSISADAANVSSPPPPNTGYSSTISHVVKTPSDSDADGGSIYLIARGKRYQFQSMGQFFAFGLKESELGYLPLDFIYSKPSGGTLPNYVSEPRGSVFQVDTAGKHLFFEYDSYISRNPSDRTAALSYYLIDKIPSGTPVTDRPVLIKYSTGDSLLYYYQNTYSTIPTFDIFQCWGFESTNKTPVYRLLQNDYIATDSQAQPLSCSYNIGELSYLLNGGSKFSVSSSIGLRGDQGTTLIEQLLARVPSAQTPLSPYVKTPGAAAVWRLENGKRRVIPTYNTFTTIGLSDINLHVISLNNLEKFPYDGFYLATGQLVKDTTSAAVFTAGVNKRFTYPTSDLFLAYRNSWGSIDTLDATTLNQNYPIGGSLSPWLIDKTNDKIYFIGNNGCYNLTKGDIQAFGATQATVDSLPYSASDFRSLRLNDCRQATRFVRIANQSLVYWVDSGVKYPLYTYSAMLQKNGGSEPVAMTLDSTLLYSLPTGTPLY